MCVVDIFLYVCFIYCCIGMCVLRFRECHCICYNYRDRLKFCFKNFTANIYYCQMLLFVSTHTFKHISIHIYTIPLYWCMHFCKNLVTEQKWFVSISIALIMFVVYRHCIYLYVYWYDKFNIWVCVSVVVCMCMCR